MKLLAIDRSTSKGTYTIVDDGTELVFAEFAESLPRSPEWFPALLESLASLNIKPQDLGAIVVGTGPGSFSGIRAVLAAAQGMALPFDIPVWGVNSSSALAFAASRRNNGATIAVLGDARRGCIWVDEGGFKPPRLVKYADIPDFLETAHASLFISPDASRVRAILASATSHCPDITESIPTARDIAAYFSAFPKSASRDPVPVYLHPAV